MSARRGRRTGHSELRELQRRAKESQKASALERARLEVQAHEKLLEVLLSVHKEQSAPRDWKSLAFPLRLPKPQKHARHEFAARREAFLADAGLFALPTSASERADTGRIQDERDYQIALMQYEIKNAEGERHKELARRVLAKDTEAYREVLEHTDPLAEVADLCLSAEYTVHTSDVIECRLRVRGTDIIPVETKSLTSTGNVSTRAMPKGRFHEIFQDYVCGSALRVGRELLDLLPIEHVLVTAFVGMSPDPDTRDHPVLSVLVSRATLDAIDCEEIDPSDAIERFLCRGDARVSRKTGTFSAVEPLTPSDIPQSPADSSLAQMLATARSLREALKTQAATLTSTGRHTADS